MAEGATVETNPEAEAPKEQKEHKERKHRSKDGHKKKKKSSSSSSSDGSVSSEKKRRHKSGVRTKFMIESLKGEYDELMQENDNLRQLIRDRLPQLAEIILNECCAPRKDVKDVDQLSELLPGMTIAEEDEEDEEDDEE
mmetsp:Transcript_2027/g.2847  ORF Transcript_2027/g.2847 Transcript_2027/m.2847 type:complete len:139 (+) Transcript_2027:149-565(+)